MTAAMTGAPTRAVTELTGRAPSKPGMRAMRLQTSARAAPQRAIHAKLVNFCPQKQRCRSKLAVSQGGFG